MNIKNKTSKLVKRAEQERFKFELRNTDYDCFSIEQKKDIMRYIRITRFGIEDLREIFQNKVIQDNIDKLIYLFEMGKSRGKSFDNLAWDLLSMAISNIRGDKDSDFDLAIGLLTMYCQTDVKISYNNVYNLACEIMFLRNARFLDSAFKARLFKSALCATPMGYELGDKMSCIYQLCDRVNKEKNKQDFDNDKSFALVEKTYRGIFDDDSAIAEIIEEVYDKYIMYDVSEDLSEYELEAFEEAFSLFSTLNSEVKRIETNLERTDLPMKKALD